MIQRDEIIAQEVGEGFPRREVAKKYGITEARVSQIMLAHHEEISDDAVRAEAIAQLDYTLQKVMETFQRPRQLKVTPSGRIVYEPLLDEDGEPLRDNRGQFIPDPSKPVYDDSPIFEAAKQVPSLLARKSQFMGLDRKAPRAVDESEAYAAQLAWAQTLADANLAVRRENEELQARIAALERGGIEDAEIIHDSPSLHQSLDLAHHVTEFIPPDPGGDGEDPDGSQ